VVLNYTQGQLVDLLVFVSDRRIHSDSTPIQSTSNSSAANDGLDSGLCWPHGTLRERAPSAPYNGVETVSTKSAVLNATRDTSTPTT
jgi:hypothetical protein